MRKKNNSATGIDVIRIILIWILSVPVILLGYPTLYLVGIGMLPTLVSWITETEKSKSRTLCIGSFNLCGVIPYIVELWEYQQKFQFVLITFKNPNTWMMMYGICTVGWTIYIGVPKLILGGLRVKAVLRIRELKKNQEQLIKEWGETVQPKKQNLLK
tara:strand:+ start:90 stop:563 length:474 start_codon:yes stop_codon:yes gene_type:complete